MSTAQSGVAWRQLLSAFLPVTPFLRNVFIGSIETEQLPRPNKEFADIFSLVGLNQFIASLFIQVVQLHTVAFTHSFAEFRSRAPEIATRWRSRRR